MKLYGITTTYNAEHEIPYVMKYLSALGYDKLIVLDNESTDRTVEMLKEYPFVEVRSFPHMGFEYYDELEFQKLDVTYEALWALLNEHKANYEDENGNPELAWITVTDFDEVPFYIRGVFTFRNFLEDIAGVGYNVCYETMPQLISERTDYDKNEFLHRQVEKCFFYDPTEWAKPILFRLDNLRYLKFTPGHHYGGFGFYGQRLKALTNTRHFFVFHLKYALGADKFRHFGYDATYDFKEYLANSIDFKDYWTHKILNGVEVNYNGYKCPWEYDENGEPIPEGDK